VEMGEYDSNQSQPNTDSIETPQKDSAV